MRLDLFLKTCRLVKRRAIARALCDEGRVLVNSYGAKPAKVVRPGDTITLTFPSRTIALTVLTIPISSKHASLDPLYIVTAETRTSGDNNLWNENLLLS